jgi:hypothetical protein
MTHGISLFRSFMHRLRLVATVAVLTATASTSAFAQTCVGRPDLAVMRGSLGAEAQFVDGASSYAGRLGINNRTAFGGLSVGYVSLDGADDVSATSFGGDIGVERHLGVSKRVHVCPIVSLTYTNGPNSDPFKSNALSAGLGASFGGSLPLTSTLSLVPYASAGLLTVRSKSEGLGNSSSDTETGGLLALGASFRFNDIVALTPSISVPVGFDNSDTVFSLGATIGFRRR